MMKIFGCEYKTRDKSTGCKKCQTDIPYASNLKPYLRIISCLPCEYSLTQLAIAFTHKGSRFKQGIIVNDSPPAVKKLSFPRIAISSNVSRQSLTNAGHIISNFLIPSFGISSKRKSV